MNAHRILLLTLAVAAVTLTSSVATLPISHGAPGTATSGSFGPVHPLLPSVRSAAAVSYPVTFSEVGLGNGVSWNVSVRGGSGDVGAFPTGAYPDSVALDPTDGHLFVACSNSNNVTVIDALTSHSVASIPVGSLPRGVLFDPATGQVYVTNLLNNTVSVVDPSTDAVVATIPTGVSPVREAVDPTNGHLYVTNVNSSNVSVLDPATHTVIGSVPVGSNPVGIAFDAANGFLYVANRGSNNVTVINGSTDTVVGAIPVGAGDRFLTYDPSNGFLYVSNYAGSNLTVVNTVTDTVVGEIDVGFGSHEGTADAANGFVYVSLNGAPGQVVVVNGSTDAVAGKIAVGNYPAGMVLDPARGLLYVTNEFSNNVSVINTTAANGGLGVEESAGNLTASGSGAVVLDLPNGTYAYSGAVVAAPNGSVYQGVPGNGTFVVAGAPVNVSVGFRLLREYTVQFNETGLPNGYLWAVEIFQANGTGFVGQRSNVTAAGAGSVEFQLANGSYSYSVWWDQQVGNILYYPERPYDGFVVNGTGPSIAVPWLHELLSSVQFNETGLPANVSWSVNVTAANATIGYAPVGSYPEADAVDTATGQLFVVNSNSDNVTIVNTSTGRSVGSVSVGALPRGIAFDAATNQMLVTNLLSNNVTVVNAATDHVVGSVSVGLSPVRLVVDPANGYVYVTNRNSSNVTVINGATDAVVGSIPVGNGPVGIALDPVRNQVFVANRFSSNVSVINATTDTVVASLPAGTDDRFLTYDPTSGKVFVANRGDGSLTVIDAATDTVVATLFGMDSPQEGVGIPTNGFVYIAENSASGGVAVFNATSDAFVGTIPTPGFPAGMAYDPANGRLYVTLEFSNAVAVIDPSFGNGGVNPTSASATPANVSTAGGGSAAALLPNGTYDFAVRPVLVGMTDYLPTPSRGTVTVSGGSVTIAVHFSAVPTYRVVFRETGLALGAEWWVSESPLGVPGFAENETNVSTGHTGTIVFQLPAGPTTIDPWALEWAVLSITGPAHPNATTVTVGRAETFVVHFAPFETVSFQEAISARWPGLNPNSTWSVTLTVRYPDGFQNSTTAFANGYAINFYVAKGAHVTYTIPKPTDYRISGGHGSFSVPGHLLLRHVRFAPYASSVVFAESGLPAATWWSVSVTGPENLTLWSPNASMLLHLVNGTYTFHIATIGGHVPVPASGSFLVTAPNALRFSVTFS
jgi:YVTN family beta-propeller protein